MPMYTVPSSAPPIRRSFNKRNRQRRNADSAWKALCKNQPRYHSKGAPECDCRYRL